MIFGNENIPTCEIAGCVRPCEPKTDASGFKPRCSRCKDRYDSQGTAFIIYCDVYRFTPIHRKKNNITQSDLLFWVCDDVVQRAPRPYHQEPKGDTTGLLHTHLDTLKETMIEADYKLSSITKSDY